MSAFGLQCLSSIFGGEARGRLSQVGTLLSAAGMVDCVRVDKFFFFKLFELLDFVTCIHGGDR